MPKATCMGMQLVWMFLDIFNDLNNRKLQALHTENNTSRRKN